MDDFWQARPPLSAKSPSCGRCCHHVLFYKIQARPQFWFQVSSISESSGQKNKFVCSFFGRSYGSTILFRDLLTFRKKQGQGLLPKGYNISQSKIDQNEFWKTPWVMSANFSVELLSDRNNSNRQALPVKRLRQLPSKLGEEFTTLNDRKLQRKQSHHPPTILSI